MRHRFCHYYYLVGIKFRSFYLDKFTRPSVYAIAQLWSYASGRAKIILISNTSSNVFGWIIKFLGEFSASCFRWVFTFGRDSTDSGENCLYTAP